MMAISRNPNEYAFVHALEPSGPRKLLSPQAIVGIMVAVALHLALIVFVYEQHFSTPFTAEPTSRAIVVVRSDGPRQLRHRKHRRSATPSRVIFRQ